MTVELNPVGIKCNLACTYCYETEMRDAGNYGPKDYDLATMQAGLLAELGQPTGGSWTLHGGEPLLMPIDDIAAMWAWGREHQQALGVQTNGALITDAHIALAKRYNVHIGISIDGPGALNDLRWQGTLDKTRAATAASERAIVALRAAGVGTSVIIVLHRLNMAIAQREVFKAWIHTLDQLGVSGVRFHPMELDGKAVEHQPTIEDYVSFYLDMHETMHSCRVLKIDLLEDIHHLMRGEDQHATCTWNKCDPYTTAAVQGVGGDGARSNCGRTNKDGVAHPKADRPGYERYVALYHTPLQAGGCQGCRFFALCAGQCPGEGMDGDWRNRSMYCGLYYALFEAEEARMLAVGQVPFSQAPDRPAVEQRLLAAWARGERIAVHQARTAVAAPSVASSNVPHGDEHGDHTDTVQPVRTHGDSHDDDCRGCHGDEHGDHTDQ